MTDGHKDIQSNTQTVGQTLGLKDRLTKGQTNWYKDGKTYQEIHGQTDGQKDGLIDGLLDG